MDLDAIVTALAARFSAANVTPPAGYGNVRTATADPPNQLGALPAVIVFLDSGEYEGAAGQRRDSNHSFLIRFYYSQTGDVPREHSALRKWLPILAGQLRSSVMLGGLSGAWGEVTEAVITSYQVGAFTYAGVEYAGIEFTADVLVNEAWEAVA